MHKSYETYFANTLNLNDKGPCMKWVCSPKFYGPLTIWPWLTISRHRSFNVIYCLILTAWQWLMSFTCIPLQIEPNKSPLRKRLLAFLLWKYRLCPQSSPHFNNNKIILKNKINTILNWELHIIQASANNTPCQKWPPPLMMVMMFNSQCYCSYCGLIGCHAQWQELCLWSYLVLLFSRTSLKMKI